MGVDRAENGNEMIFESPNGSFCRIGSMFFRRHALKSYIVFCKGIFEILGAFVDENVKIGRMACWRSSVMLLRIADDAWRFGISTA
jgi:hypothetical protein